MADVLRNRRLYIAGSCNTGTIFIQVKHAMGVDDTRVGEKLEDLKTSGQRAVDEGVIKVRTYRWPASQPLDNKQAARGSSYVRG